MSAPATVDALLPLSLLEAMRTVDAPEDGHDTEYVPELRNKRLGLSEPIYAQIRRYSLAAKKSQRTPYDEAVAIARLIGRRGDAAAVFASAGRILARQSYVTASPFARQVILILPALLARPLALSQARRIAKRFLNGKVSRVGSSLRLVVSDSVTLDTAPKERGCSYYESVLRELIRLLVGGTGAVEHVRCASRGQPTCEWRVEWRPLDRRRIESATP
jgi:predicted hydrocarbon binding protein